MAHHLTLSIFLYSKQKKSNHTNISFIFDLFSPIPILSSSMASSSSYHHPTITSSSPSQSFDYDVFISFRGEDTRKTFVDYLYATLTDQLISTYKDDVTLPRGESISPSLFKAIEGSRIAVIIFSENYADSSWCLKELAHVMKCRDERKLIVMPIFYCVDPSEVRKQKGKFGEAFHKHKIENNSELETWRKALVSACEIAGWETKNIGSGHEMKAIKEIVKTISYRLFLSTSYVDNDEFVGMELRMRELEGKLEIGSNGVRMVGIWGVGGSGKTTLASSLYRKISHKFKGCCMIENVREESSRPNGLKILQEKLILELLKTKKELASVQEGNYILKSRLSQRNVLIILDDVDDKDQLEALAGSHNWFGSGSRVIITTRNEHVLNSHKVDQVCPVTLLIPDEAIKLFNRRAYNKEKPIKDFETLSLSAVRYAAGLPLALKVLSSSLYDKDEEEWRSTLDRLKDNPEMKIVDKLKISYDGLTYLEQQLFLDIACFFRRKDKSHAMEIFEACGYHSPVSIKALIQKALIYVVDDEFDMHDLIQEMAHYIVKGDHPNNPEKHSRVWEVKNIMHLARSTMESHNTEAIYVDNPSGLDDARRDVSPLLCKMISNMKELRWIRVVNLRYENAARQAVINNQSEEAEAAAHQAVINNQSEAEAGQSVIKNQSVGQSVNNNQSKSRWCCFPRLPCFTGKEVEDAVIGQSVINNRSEAETETDSSQSIVNNRSEGEAGVIDEGPSFLSNELMYISWEGYPNSPFPDSFQLKKLVILRLIKGMQNEIWKGMKFLPQLKVLELFKMENLLSTPNFSELPCLQKLTIRTCKRLKSFHPSLGMHPCLEDMTVSFCEELSMFPTISQLEKLKTFDILKCPRVEFPEIKSNMKSLVKLSLNQMEIDVLLSSIGEKRFPNLTSLALTFCYLNDKETKYHPLKNLEEFTFLGVRMLSGENQCRSECLSWLSLVLSHSTSSLRKLSLSDCGLRDGEIPQHIGELSNLRELSLSSNDFSRLDFSLLQLTRLKDLSLGDCKRLIELPELPSSLAKLDVSFCSSLNSIGDFYKGCKRLSEVSIRDMNIIPESSMLLDSMLQGKTIENHAMLLEFEGFDIARRFEPPLARGTTCQLKLPENWRSDFSGFLICCVLTEDGRLPFVSRSITMKPVTSGMDSEDDIVWEESDGDKYTWLFYVPFAKLRNSPWWNSTYETISFDIIHILPFEPSEIVCRGFGVRLISSKSGSDPKETFSTTQEEEEYSQYTPKFKISHDPAALKISFPHAFTDLHVF